MMSFLCIYLNMHHSVIPADFSTVCRESKRYQKIKLLVSNFTLNPSDSSPYTETWIHCCQYSVLSPRCALWGFCTCLPLRDQALCWSLSPTVLHPFPRRRLRFIGLNSHYMCVHPINLRSIVDDDDFSISLTGETLKNMYGMSSLLSSGHCG